MVQTEKIAIAIKNYIINLAINDELPMDLNDLNEYALEEVIKSQLPTEQEEAIKLAENYLYSDEENNISIADMVKLISEHSNQDELIDYVDGVQVWQKIELEFTCKEFLKEIGLK